MAQRVITIMEDDLTGEEGEDVQTVTFALDGKYYEIDLSEANHDKLVETLNPYILAGRTLGRGGTRRGEKRGPSRKRATSPDSALIRDWAKKNGYEVNERGRIPAAIVDAYKKATN